MAKIATGPKYKRSPFYDVLESVTKELEIPSKFDHLNTTGKILNDKELEGHRQQLPLTMSLSQTQVDRIKMDPSLRIYLFCCSDATTGAHSGVDVAFPHQLEIKVNGEEVKANYKGLKNKPGTTRPADITSFCRTKLASYANQISVMFALTTRRYMMQAWLVKKRSVTELTEKIRQGRFISKQRVLNESMLTYTRTLLCYTNLDFSDRKGQ